MSVNKQNREKSVIFCKNHFSGLVQWPFVRTPLVTEARV